MDIAIRDTTEADLPAIYRIQCDPLVRPHQYKLSHRDTLDAMKQQLFDQPQKGRFLHKCKSIVLHNEVIGHINHVHYEIRGQKLCYCGWNLAPAYWGNGIIMTALSQLFGELFAAEGIYAVFSECFSDNQRCLRVLHKLDFAPMRIPPFHRMKILLAYRCFHWIRRFQLTADRWRARLPEGGK